MAQTMAKLSFGPALVIVGPRCPLCAIVGPALTSIGLRGCRAPLMAPCGSSLVVVAKGQWWLKTGGPIVITIRALCIAQRRSCSRLPLGDRQWVVVDGQWCPKMRGFAGKKGWWTLR